MMLPIEKVEACDGTTDLCGGSHGLSSRSTALYRKPLFGHELMLVASVLSLGS
jgi:hypothetical protein